MIAAGRFLMGSFYVVAGTPGRRLRSRLPSWNDAGDLAPAHFFCDSVALPELLQEVSRRNEVARL